MMTKESISGAEGHPDWVCSKQHDIDIKCRENAKFLSYIFVYIQLNSVAFGFCCSLLLGALAFGFRGVSGLLAQWAAEWVVLAWNDKAVVVAATAAVQC